MGDQGYYIGIEVAESRLKAALTDARGEILEIEQPEVPRQSADALGQVAAATIMALQGQARARGGQVVAIGVGVPAVVDPQTQRIERAANLPILEQIDLAAYLSASAHVPVVLDHNANVAALGEFLCGAAQGLRNVMYVDLGADISAGLILDGKLYRGALGLAGGFGHMTVNPDGWECACGNIGCLDTIASETNLVRRTKDRLFHDRSSSLSSLALPGRGELTAQRIAMEALNGDDFALMMLERTGKWLGLALGNVINLLNLDMVVLAGSVMVAGELLLRSVIKEVQTRALETPRNHCRIVASVLGGQAGLIGAAMLAQGARQR